MLKRFWKSLQTKPWLKILAIILFTLCGVGVLLGIIFSALNVSKVSQSKEGMSLAGSVQTTLHVQVNQSDSQVEQLQAVEKDTNALVQQLKINGVTQINANYGLQKIYPSTANTTGLWCGVINLFTPESNALFAYTTGDSIANEATQAFSIFLRLNNAYNLQLQNITGSLLKDGTASPNFKGVAYAINSQHKLTLNINNPTNPQLTIQLANQWNLNNFQEQFTKVFPGWNGKLTYQQVMAKNPKNMLKKGNNPTKLLVLWNNRSGLIRELQLVTLIVYLSQNRSSLGQTGNVSNIASQTSQINALYQGLTSQEKAFGHWMLANIRTAMPLLMSAQSGGMSTQEPLLTLLGEYYSSQIYENSLGTANKPNPWLSNPGAFLYSWNLTKLSLVNKFFTTIDYTNFFNYFQFNLKKITKTAFSTKTFIFNQPANTTKYEMNKTRELYNNGALVAPLIDPSLLNFTAYGATSAQENANNLSNFLSFVQITTHNVGRSVTHLSAYAGAMVGLSVLILLVGIIVSLLYRFPGVLATLFSGLVFLITATIYPNVGLTFYFNTVIGLMITALIPFLLVINWVEAIKTGIRRGLNLTNATTYGLKVYLRNVLSVYLAVLIVGIVFLFFGQGQLQGFGTVLVVGDLLTILFFVFIYIVLYYVAQWLFVLNHPATLLTKRYQKLLVQISQVKFGSLNLEGTSRLDHFVQSGNLKRLAWVFLPMVLLIVAGIIGLIVLGVLGPGFSIYFGHTTLLSFTLPVAKGASSQNSLTTTIVNNLAQALNVSWFQEITGATVQGLTGTTQVVTLETSTHLAVATVYQVLGNIAPSLVPTLAVQFGNHAMPSLIRLNLIDVVMISVAFLAILAFITLNFINVLPIIFVLTIGALTTTGILGFFRMPMDQNTLISYGQIWMVLVTLVFFQFTNYKIDYKMKQSYSGVALRDFVLKQFLGVARMTTIWSALYLLSTLVMMLFNSTSFVFQILVLTLAIFFIYFITVPLIPLLFYSGMLLRRWYMGKIMASRTNRTTHKNYDKVDEQEIYGLNKH